MTVFAYATDTAVALKEGGGGIRANDWVSRTLQVSNFQRVFFVYNNLPIDTNSKQFYACMGNSIYISTLIYVLINYLWQRQHLPHRSPSCSP